MKLGKNEYACVFLQPGYWETGVLRNFFQAGASDDPKLPAYFWTDNCDFDSDANCYKFVLSPLHDNKLVVVQKTAPPPGEIGKMGFKLPERSSR